MNKNNRNNKNKTNKRFVLSSPQRNRGKEASLIFKKIHLLNNEGYRLSDFFYILLRDYFLNHSVSEIKKHINHFESLTLNHTSKNSENYNLKNNNEEQTIKNKELHQNIEQDEKEVKNNVQNRKNKKKIKDIEEEPLLAKKIKTQEQEQEIEEQEERKESFTVQQTQEQQNIKENEAESSFQEDLPPWMKKVVEKNKGMFNG